MKWDGFSGTSGVMLEIPAAIIGAADFVQAGARNLLIGLNDLSCLTLGRDRGPKEMKQHPSIWKLVDIVRDGVAGKVEWGIAGSLTPEVLGLASKCGATYISVHYAEAASLLNFAESAFPASSHVRDVKMRTLEAKAAMRKQSSHC